MVKIAIIEHMADGHNDRVKQYFKAQGCELSFFNPARGVPLAGNVTDYAATVVYGGVQSVNDAAHTFIQDEVAWLSQCVQSDRPVLGICLGAQLLTLASGGSVRAHPDGLHEVGFTRINPVGDGVSLFADNATFYQWHNEGCTPGSDVELLATGDVFDCQAFRIGQRQYGLQFHPEAAGCALESWWADVPDMESLPGCQPVSRQRADAEQMDPVIDRWMQQFLAHWQTHW